MNNIKELLKTELDFDTVLLNEEEIPLKFKKIKSFLMFTKDLEVLKKNIESFNNMVCNRDEVELELIPAILKIKYVRK